MRFIHSGQAEEEAEEEDEQMTKIKRQFEYFTFFTNFKGKLGTDDGKTMRPATGDMNTEGDTSLRALVRVSVLYYQNLLVVNLRNDVPYWK